MALNSVVWQGSAVVGPAVAGLILALWGLPGSFNINVVSDFVSLIAVLAVRVPAMPALAHGSPSALTDAVDGALYAWRSRGVRALLLSVALVTFLARPYSQFMPVFARDVFDVGPQGLGLMLSTPAIGTIAVGFLLATVQNLPLVRSFIISSVVFGTSIMLFCWTRSFPVALVCLFVIGACASGSTTMIQTRLQELVDERMRGRLMSLFMAATWGSWRLGSLPIGLAADAWGAPLAVGAASALLLVALVPLARNRALWATESPELARR
jgi:MFS family permease